MEYVIDIVAHGGTQCCSMRDHSSSVAAQKAAAEGRPPKKFPPPRRSKRDGKESSDGNDRQRPSTISHDDAPPPRAKRKEEAPWKEESRKNPSAENWSDVRSDRHSNIHPDVRPSSRSDVRSDADLTHTQVVPRPTPPATQRSRAGPKPGVDDTRASSHKSESALPSSFRSSPRTKENVQVLPFTWDWPDWCLHKNPPCIEVYVEDEETNTWHWLPGDPESRVVDKHGKDAYLCAEYDWEGEFFVQDFGPTQVRRAGMTLSVADMLRKERSLGGGIMGGGKVGGGAGGEGSGERPHGSDMGGGVARLLDESF